MPEKPVASQKTPPVRRTAAPRTGASRPGVRGGAGRTLSRSTRDERGGRLAWLVGGGIAVVVLLLLGLGYYNDNIGPARDTALVVGKHEISVGYFRDRLKADTKQNGDGSQTDAVSKESSLQDTLAEEQVYLQRAASLGVSVNDDDIALALARLVKAPVKDGKIADIAVYESLVRNQLTNNGLSLDQFRGIARANALKDKALERFRATVPKQALAIKGFQLAFTTEQAGRTAQERLGNGDSFADFSADALQNPSIGRAAPLDWTPVPFGLLPAAADDVASKLSPGEVSDLIKLDPTTPTGQPTWTLLNISDRDSNHEVTDAQAAQIAQKQRDNWLSDEKTALGVSSKLDTKKRAWAAQHTGLPLAAKASPTPKAAPRPAGAPPLPTVPAVPGGQVGPQPAASAPAQPAAPPAPNATP